MSTGTTTPPAGGGQPQNQPRHDRRLPEPFTIEFGDDFLRNHTVNTPPFQMVLRGAFSLARLARRERDGKKYDAREVGTAAGRIPDMPGARMEINCRTREVRLFDPLDSPDGKELLQRYESVAKSEQAQGLLPKNLAPFKAVEHTLDENQLKTLVYEIGRKLTEKCCRVVAGEFPRARDIDALPGDELYDPQNTGALKPRIKKYYDAWVTKMQEAGSV